MALLTANLSQEHEKSAKRGISKINIQYFSPWLNYCIFISPKIDFFHIPAQAASVLCGGINIGERLIGGKTVLINLAEKQSQIMRDPRTWSSNSRWHSAFKRLTLLESSSGNCILKTYIVTLNRINDEIQQRKGNLLGIH